MVRQGVHGKIRIRNRLELFSDDNSTGELTGLQNGQLGVAVAGPSHAGKRCLPSSHQFLRTAPFCPSLHALRAVPRYSGEAAQSGAAQAVKPP